MVLFKCLLVFLMITLTNGSADDIMSINQHAISAEVPNYPNYLKEAIANLFKTAKTEYCALCEVLSTTAMDIRKGGLTEKLCKEFGVVVCKLLTNHTEVVCQGWIHLYFPVVSYIIDNRPYLTAKRICGIIFDKRNCIDPLSKPWSIHIPKRIFPELPPINITARVKKIVHITDIHYDPLYEEGSNSVCGNPLCCESVNGNPDRVEDSARYWGDYHLCDAPWHAIENLFQQIETGHPQIDLVYFTGDIVSHKTWATSKQYNSDSITKVTKQFKDTFKNIPVYPVLGNHDSHPANLFAPNDVPNKELSTKWLFSLVAKEWSRWLPPESLETVVKGGYYTVLVERGFRIIGLNSNVFNTGNLWLIYNDYDPYDQLQWLAETLFKAENNQETVHILSHIPPGSKDCLKQWNYEYRRIVDRFANTITAQFNGHTHNDEIRIFYGLNKPSQVVNVAFVGGSFSTFGGLNPNYRIYDVESNYHNVLDYHQWYYNLSDANLRPFPQWKKLYSFKNAYNLDKLDAQNYHSFVQKISSHDSPLNQYRKYLYRNSEVQLSKRCNQKCRKSLYCSVTGVEYKDLVQCQGWLMSLREETTTPKPEVGTEEGTDDTDDTKDESQNFWVVLAVFLLIVFIISVVLYLYLDV